MYQPTNKFNAYEYSYDVYPHSAEMWAIEGETDALEGITFEMIDKRTRVGDLWQTIDRSEIDIKAFQTIQNAIQNLEIYFWKENLNKSDIDVLALIAGKSYGKQGKDFVLYIF